ncbi:MAG: hypothetical protein ACXW4E_07780 [Anaerolineales bacterium]
MTTPDSNQNESSRMKKMISGDMDDSIRSRLPAGNGANPPTPRTLASTPPVPSTVPSPAPTPRGPRFKFLPAFWTIASVLSLVVNVILIIILLLAWQMLGQISTLQTYGLGEASGLLGGLYQNFVKMDEANIQTSIHVEKEIPVQFSLNVSGPTNVTLSQPVTIRGATVWVQTGGLNIRDANATIVLPAGVVLPIIIENLVVPVDQKVLAVLDVPVDIPLDQTELHEPFVGLQEVVKPWYCLVEPNATFNDSPVCPQMTNPTLPIPTPVGTVIP